MTPCLEAIDDPDTTLDQFIETFCPKIEQYFQVDPASSSSIELNVIGNMHWGSQTIPRKALENAEDPNAVMKACVYHLYRKHIDE